MIQNIPNKLKLWIRILNMLFALSIAFKLWIAFSTRKVSESWTYCPGANFKMNGTIITNRSPDTGIWIDSHHYSNRDTWRIDKADLLDWLLAGIPIVMINIHARTYRRGGTESPPRQS